MSDLRETVRQYQEGLAAQVALLEALVRTASAQHDASLGGDATALAACWVQRDELMRSLLATEDMLQPLRARVASDLAAAENVPGFDAVRKLHQLAQRLLADVRELDSKTSTQLQQREGTRRATVHALDAGEATLAAYRKALSPASPPSSIVDQRG